MTRPPACSAIAIIRPSTCSGTPESIRAGGLPSRSGQACLTRSWLPPMPPEATITAWARSSKAPAAVRELGLPRGVSLGSSTAPATPSMTPFVAVSVSTRCLNRSDSRPAATAARTRRSNGSTTPGPVPHVMWNRGTELPWPVAW
jgi:hypothetical protein